MLLDLAAKDLLCRVVVEVEYQRDGLSEEELCDLR